MEIKELELYTHNLNSLKSFYTKTLGLAPIEDTQSFFSLNIGNSKLKFVSKSDTAPYHFAFTIPANKESEALNWLKQRVEILRYEEDEIIDFINWNAKSIYFYDPDKNIAEFIARKNLANHSNSPFSGKSLVEISEIGMPTDSIENAYNVLNQRYGLEVYDGSFDKFCAVGDERGLFIVIDKNKKKWFPTDDRAYASDFRIKIEPKSLSGAFAFVNGEIKIFE